MLKLVIGNKNYSSWSMRPWVLMTQAGIAFEEIQVWLAEPDTAAQIACYSSSGTVPVLIDQTMGRDFNVWDSLAICEYLAEQFPAKHLWPKDWAQRARARSLSSQMHAGFTALRTHMPMNIRNRYPGKGMTPEVAADIAHLQTRWNDCIDLSGGPFLFGSFGIADAMFAPVVFRLQTYGVSMQGRAAAYVQHMLTAPALVKLAQLAAVEGHATPRYDDKYA